MKEEVPRQQVNLGRTVSFRRCPLIIDDKDLLN